MPSSKDRSRDTGAVKMNEAELCTIIVKSGTLLYKIPDPTGLYNRTIKRPCDIIGRLEFNGKYYPAFIEAKYMNTLRAFNLNRIEPHQADFLTQWSKIEGAYCFIILGISVNRGDIRAYIFDWKSLRPLYKSFSIHKKYLSLLPYNPIQKKRFSWNTIITTEILENTYKRNN